MASTIEFVKYVVDQIKGAGIITYKKMFGEYLLYANQKPVVLICDDTAYVKMLDCVKSHFENPASSDGQACASEDFPPETGFPYNGAKEHYIVDVDNSELLSKIVQDIEKVTKIPKKKTSNKKSP
jgi:hypothetical protein